MEQKYLDALLDGSAPRVAETNATDALVLQLVDDTARPRRRSRRSRLAIASLAVAGTLALGTGAAIVAPFVADWWMWIPGDDLVLVTDPFEQDGELITCTTRLRVIIEGKSATDDSTERLQRARDYMRSVNVDDFSDEVDRMVEQAGDDYGPYMSAEAGRHGLLTIAIALEMSELGLTGEGVGVDIEARCPPAE